MLEGCVPWPADLAARYRAAGWWEGLTIPEMLARSAARHPDKTALVAGDLRLAYRDLVQTSDRLACRFLDAGVRPLDRVVVQLPNGPEFVHTYFALTRIGESFLREYVARNWEEIRHTVGAYRIEGEGVRLFGRIEGDPFTIIGLPLIELLTWLRARGDIAA